MNRPKMFLAVLGPVALALMTPPVAPGQDPADKPLAKKLTVVFPKVGDLAPVLGITSVHGEFELHPKGKRASLVLQLYKDGRLYNERGQTDLSTLGVTFSQLEPIQRGKFSMHAVDLDYLPLGGGKKEHCRIRVELALRTGSVITASDVPKSLFDFSKGLTQVRFDAAASTPTVVLLFWMGAKLQNGASGKTVKEVIELNQKGKLLIVSLHIE